MGFLNIFGSTHLEKGNKLANDKKFAEAIPHLVRAIELNQNPGFAAMKLAFCYQFMGKLSDAERAFGLAVELNPANVQGWIMRSIVQVWQGKLQDAAATARNGLRYAVTRTQELDCYLAVLQSLAVQIEAVGYHRCAGVRSAADYRRELDSNYQARGAIVREAQPVLDRCLGLAMESPDVHKFYALIDIYKYDLKNLVLHASELQRLDAAKYVEIRNEYLRCYGQELPSSNDVYKWVDWSRLDI
jgi:tetratricopeptide (TPR) repeat protein